MHRAKSARVQVEGHTLYDCSPTMMLTLNIFCTMGTEPDAGGELCRIERIGEQGSERNAICIHT